MKYNPADNPIVVKCKAHQTEPIDRLIEFQGNLKRLSEKNREKLIGSICTKGFIAPIFVWDDHGEWKLLDGHQRLKTLIWMRQHGWDIPMLPVELYINAYLNNSEEGDYAYEPFSGSGTALIAGEKVGRKVRAIELDPKYVAVALERWSEITGKTPELMNASR